MELRIIQGLVPVRELIGQPPVKIQQEGRTFGPRCRCGSRNTRTIGASALLRQCQHPDCGQTYAYRVHQGHLIPFSLDMAEALDDSRKGAL